MKPRTRTRHAASSAILVAALLVAPSQSYAQYEGSSPEANEESSDEGARKKPKLWSPKPKGVYLVGKRTGKWVGEAYGRLAKNDFVGARDAMGNLRLSALNPLERATSLQAYAFISYGEEDLEGSIELLEKAIAENALSAERSLDLRYQIAQLHLALQNWQAVIDNLNIWFSRVEKPNSSAYNLLALCYFQLERFEEALEPAQMAVSLAEKPQEAWLQLLLALRLIRKEYGEAIPIIEELVRNYPKKEHWVKLSTVHGARGDFEEALIPLQLAYEQGLLNQSEELKRLGQLLLFLDLPYRAALVLEEGLASEKIKPEANVYEMLSNAWIASREFEKAVAPLEKAAKVSGEGDSYMRLAQVHLQREKWGAAVAAAERALETDNLTSRGQAWLLLGIARYSREQPRQAIASFERAREFDDSRKEAENWVAHIERELQSAS